MFAIALGFNSPNLPFQTRVQQQWRLTRCLTKRVSRYPAQFVMQEYVPACLIVEEKMSQVKLV